jgi:hypothetical protein
VLRVTGAEPDTTAVELDTTGALATGAGAGEPPLTSSAIAVAAAATTGTAK